MIQNWPAESRTAETLFVREEEGDVLLLNELKFRKDTALKLRFPLNQYDDLPAARAVMEVEGIVEGRDYRGILVLASVKAVPDYLHDNKGRIIDGNMAAKELIGYGIYRHTVVTDSKLN